MRIRVATILFATVLVLSLVSCSGDRSPTVPAEAGRTPALRSVATGMAAPEYLINNYLVRFDGRVVEGGNTTFGYTVRGTGVEPSVSHFTVEIPDCTADPVAFSPTGSVSINYDPNTGLYGIDWHLKIDPYDPEGISYTVTFPGDVPLGEVQAAVKTGDVFGLGTVPGPCAGFDISGRVFVDGDADGTLDVGESGVGDVVVELVDGEGRVQAVPTDATGYYVFRKAEGTYAINLKIDGVSYPDYFNGVLGDSFDPTTPLTASATVGPDSPGHDFGFSPRTKELILELETGVLLSDGESVKYWTRILRSARNNSHPPGGYDPATVVGFIAAIDGLLIENPYDFPEGTAGLDAAFAILRSNSKEPIDLLLKELLATELNHVSGRGLIGQLDLQLALISWGESLIADTWATSRVAGGDDLEAVVLRAPREALSEAVALFELMNTGGGGGPDE